MCLCCTGVCLKSLVPPPQVCEGVSQAGRPRTELKGVRSEVIRAESECGKGVGGGRRMLSWTLSGRVYTTG